jgi:hypothetical protein
MRLARVGNGRCHAPAARCAWWDMACVEGSHFLKQTLPCWWLQRSKSSRIVVGQHVSAMPGGHPWHAAPLAGRRRQWQVPPPSAGPSSGWRTPVEEKKSRKKSISSVAWIPRHDVGPGQGCRADETGTACTAGKMICDLRTLTHPQPLVSQPFGRSAIIARARRSIKARQPAACELSPAGMRSLRPLRSLQLDGLCAWRGPAERRSECVVAAVGIRLVDGGC